MKARKQYLVALLLSVTMLFCVGWASGGAWKQFWTRANGIITFGFPGDDLDLDGGKLILDADSDTYWKEYSDDVVYLYIAGADRFQFEALKFQSDTSYGFRIRTSAGDASNPVYTYASEANTGDYSPAADQLAATAGGVEAERIIEANSVIYTLTGSTEQDSVTDATTNGTTTVTKTGDNFLTTAAANDIVLFWSGTTTADYGLYEIRTVTDDDNLVLDRALTGSVSDMDFYIFRGGQIQSANMTALPGRLSADTMTYAFTADGDITTPLTGTVILLDGDNDGTGEDIDLQDGTTIGQMVILVAAADIDAAGPDNCTIDTSTDTTCTNCPAIVFDTVGESATLVWTGSTWVVVVPRQDL
ncbi:MAG: hypothetical protein GY841_16025 [FCB group bacterium]|nr:hypothetical protein [FCB group bacterium]